MTRDTRSRCPETGHCRPHRVVTRGSACCLSWPPRVVWAVANGLRALLGRMKGHFRKRGDKWYFWAELGTDGDGKRQRVSRGGFRTRREAEAAFAAMRDDLRKGAFVSETKTMHKALHDAVRWGRLGRNPADLADPPAARSQLRKFLKSVEGDRLYAMWLMYATTGMRRGEVLGLR